MFDRSRAAHRQAMAHTLDHTMGLHSAPVPKLLAFRNSSRRAATALTALAVAIGAMAWHLHWVTLPVALFPVVPAWWEASSARAFTREITSRPADPEPTP